MHIVTANGTTNVWDNLTDALDEVALHIDLGNTPTYIDLENMKSYFYREEDEAPEVCEIQPL